MCTCGLDNVYQSAGSLACFPSSSFLIDVGGPVSLCDAVIAVQGCGVAFDRGLIDTASEFGLWHHQCDLITLITKQRLFKGCS